MALPILLTCNLFKVGIIALVSCLSFNSDVTFHTNILCWRVNTFEAKFGLKGIALANSLTFPYGNQYISPFSTLSLVYHRSVWMNNLPGENSFLTTLVVSRQMSSPCKLAVDMCPCLFTPEPGNMSSNCGNCSCGWQHLNGHLMLNLS